MERAREGGGVGKRAVSEGDEDATACAEVQEEKEKGSCIRHVRGGSCEQWRRFRAAATLSTPTSPQGCVNGRHQQQVRVCLLYDHRFALDRACEGRMELPARAGRMCR